MYISQHIFSWFCRSNLPFPWPGEDVTVTANFEEDDEAIRHYFETEWLQSLSPFSGDPGNMDGTTGIADLDIPVDVIKVYFKTTNETLNGEIDLFIGVVNVTKWTGTYPFRPTVTFEDGVGSFTLGNRGTDADITLSWGVGTLDDQDRIGGYHEDHEIVEICVEWEE